jgi:hypothetical protein
MKVHVAFGFHLNLYHSFREDTNDQKGFAGDIRVIRNTIDALNRCNAHGIPVKGTWDCENAFSLEETLPLYARDIIQNLQERTKKGDEHILMGYNNGALGAMTKTELEASIKRAVTNEKGSGLKDLFGAYEPIVRPQEMMFSPSQTQTYSELGISALCLYYSSIPFDGFRTLVPLLPEKFAFNPLAYHYRESVITIIPTYNNGDLIDYGSLRFLARRLHSLPEMDTDVLIFINMDADSEFWYGYPFPMNRLPNLSGIEGLIRDVADLPFVVFDTPGNYIKTHPPVAGVSFTHDIADGNFDGFSSWSEKPFNRQIWTRLERARALKPKPNREEEQFQKRIRLLSTTHFGLSTPHLNVRREQKALALSAEMLSCADPAVPACTGPAETWSGGECENIRYCLPRTFAPGPLVSPSPAVAPNDGSGERKIPRPFLCRFPRIQYGGREYRPAVKKRSRFSLNIAGRKVNGALLEAEINLPGQIEAGFFSLSRYTAEGINALFYSVRIKYPYTPEDAYVFNEIAALQRPQDDRWLEVCPLEIFAGKAAGKKIIKRNYEEDISEYGLDDFVKADPLNTDIDSFNHQVTNGIVGVQGERGGFLLAVHKQLSNSMAVCPMRICGGRLYLNPFGTYYGRQRHHATHGNGLGAQVAVYAAPQFFPLAPSYNGADETFLLAFFPFEKEPDARIFDQTVSFCEGSIAADEIEKDFCVARAPGETDRDIKLKKITSGIPAGLQLKIIAAGIIPKKVKK